MNTTFFKSPLGLIIIGIVIAIIPLFFNNDTVLILMRLISFGIFFFAVPLFVKDWLRSRRK